MHRGSPRLSRRARWRITRIMRTAAVSVAAVAVVVGSATAAGASPLPGSGAARSEPAIMKMADLRNFQPGNIISDAVFFNPATMSAAQIQSFLQARVPSCQSGYICLKDWYDTSRATSADPMCGPYAGGYRERASDIIYKVAQACGINPQVILATLQKEQGLVTHTWPSEWRYTIAMGQGCPDTAACDTRYYGFFNQVYGAARQFKRYANPPGTSQYFTWYAPGRTWNVLYNPNQNCGSSPVYIQNQATANLYYYTPYQPNAAALAAGYGLGDGCSAYGNRNFYNYFTDWFGSTQRTPAAEIDAEYQAQGGLGSLGEPITAVTALYRNGGGFGRAYVNGSIYWTYSTGAKTVRAGPLRDYYFARGGADGDMGWPMLNQQILNMPSGAGSGQLFTGGSLYAGPGGIFIVRDPLRAGYFSLSGAAGALGWPVSEQSCSADVCRQGFMGGIVVSSRSGAYPVVEPMLSAFDAAGGVAGSWGVPLTSLTFLSYHGGGYGQAFANVSAFFRPGATMYHVSGPIRDRYFATGGAAGPLGYPAGAQQCTGASSCQQQFEFGWVLWTVAGGSRVGAPAIDAAYAASGGEGGALGPRTNQFVYYAYNGGGFAEGFANGAIFYKPAVGAAFAVSGPIRDRYFATGGAAGPLGYPVGAQQCTGASSCQQQFEFGWVLWTAAGGSRVGAPAIDAAYAASGGGGGALGPRTNQFVYYAYNGGGFAEGFANGAIFYKPAVGAAFAVSGPIRDRYFATGGAAGPFGWPTSAVACANGSCRQAFEGGTITASG